MTRFNITKKSRPLLVTDYKTRRVDEFRQIANRDSSARASRSDEARQMIL